MMRHGFFRRIALLNLALAMPPAWADGFEIVNHKISRNADGVLAMMAFSVVPDLNSSSLSIGSGSGSAERTDIFQTQYAGGGTISDSVPLYLEGGFAFMRYDPSFVASKGAERRLVPLKWNTVSVTGGLGWDFKISDHWVLRPIVNFSLGHVASDIDLFVRFLEWQTDYELSFIDGGSLSAYGLGGSLMLDYELVSPEHEIDLEIRYTNIGLNTFANPAAVVKGSANAEAAGIYARYRAPTGITLLERPLRYVLEGSNTQYLGDQRNVLGIDSLSTLGLGIELDSSAYDVIVTRTRLVARYSFGAGVRGVALGFAVSF